MRVYLVVWSVVLLPQPVGHGVSCVNHQGHHSKRAIRKDTWVGESERIKIGEVAMVEVKFSPAELSGLRAFAIVLNAIRAFAASKKASLVEGPLEPPIRDPPIPQGAKHRGLYPGWDQILQLSKKPASSFRSPCRRLLYHRAWDVSMLACITKSPPALLVAHSINRVLRIGC